MELAHFYISIDFRYFFDNKTNYLRLLLHLLNLISICHFHHPNVLASYFVALESLKNNTIDESVEINKDQLKKWLNALSEIMQIIFETPSDSDILALIFFLAFSASNNFTSTSYRVTELPKAASFSQSIFMPLSVS